MPDQKEEKQTKRPNDTLLSDYNTDREQLRRLRERCERDSKELVEVLREIPNVSEVLKEVEKLREDFEKLEEEFEQLGKDLQKWEKGITEDVDSKLDPIIIGKEKLDKFLRYSAILLFTCFLLGFDLSDIKKLILGVLSRILI